MLQWVYHRYKILDIVNEGGCLRMNKTKVLVVEDDANISKLISDYLSAHGYDVAAFLDGPDAIKYVKQEGLPHIALIDLALPTMHGFDLSSKLKSMGDVPIIFVTSTSDTETIVQGLKRYEDDLQNGLLEADYIVIEMANQILGAQWLPEYVAAANAGGIERVLV